MGLKAGSGSGYLEIPDAINNIVARYVSLTDDSPATARRSGRPANSSGLQQSDNGHPDPEWSSLPRSRWDFASAATTGSLLEKDLTVLFRHVQLNPGDFYIPRDAREALLRELSKGLAELRLAGREARAVFDEEMTAAIESGGLPPLEYSDDTAVQQQLRHAEEEWRASSPPGQYIPGLLLFTEASAYKTNRPLRYFRSHGGKVFGAARTDLPAYSATLDILRFLYDDYSSRVLAGFCGVGALTDEQASKLAIAIDREWSKR